MVVNGYPAKGHTAHLRPIGLPLEDIVVQEGLIEQEAVFGGHNDDGGNFYYSICGYGGGGEHSPPLAMGGCYV